MATTTTTTTTTRLGRDFSEAFRAFFYTWDTYLSPERSFVPPPLSGKEAGERGRGNALGGEECARERDRERERDAVDGGVVRPSNERNE